ncbi:hypothetical protein BVZ31_00760 [Alcaligenes faecalis]|uniref:hypothetical protein n=1 Tax=Alcaligenes faecalis TaxID=511 RepID=UPI000A2E0475|nr:hypothetical protein [Alcaligenes faecalis]OSZ45838.1 hypothetical protein BVZ30_02325 [Alcaligenes faecalis]OSZ52839.1 hypothetical protein BVZ31_00760 [Alcaligenes faecalis]OSZ54799.1 hypothetical protein BVZ32_03120 [Alcaligenes faecalis]
MTNEQLFVHLLHRLRKYSDALVLHVILQDHGDKRQVKTSAVKMALDSLRGQIQRWQVQRSLERLESLGLINVMPQPNYRTLVTVNQEALLAFLNQEPLSGMLPGIRANTFPFLDAVNATALADFKGSTI